jgi:hypothetical protein
LSAEIDVEPSVLSQYGDDREKQGANDQLPATGDSLGHGYLFEGCAEGNTDGERNQADWRGPRGVDQ